MTYDWIVGIDPSGAFTEGKGTTGICLLHAEDMKIVYAEDITARSFPNKESYWQHHLNTLQEYLFNRKQRGLKAILVIEDFLLYENKANSLVNSRMETSKLIGIIQLWCYKHNIPYKMQLASEVKQRWADPILEWKGYIQKKGARYNYNNHIRDSIRHAVHFATFKNGGIRHED
ncbi:MAG: hypothetical protein PHY39_06170 [Endomicrobiaceae bacterium]|nr:hypothetical protein [Endomicrobiaceae bacterium]